MFDRAHGTSGYHPTQALHHRRSAHQAPEKKPKPRRPQKPWVRWLTWLAVLAGGLFVLTSLFLGEFRFMLTKTPSLTGFPFGSREYLVLFQNNYELRPTGGFISTYGVLSFSHGVYKGIEFHDVYADVDDHDYVEPPLILSVLLEDEDYGGHTFRDANFDPDFTLAKEDLLEFYALTQPDAEIDGIIAADFTFLETLVGLYEPLKVEGYELTQDNLFETLSSAVSDIDRHNEAALAERKNITSPIVKRIITKSIVLPWRIKTVLNTLHQGFEEKHVIASFNRRGLKNAFAERGWDGTLPQSNAGDFLAINDANYGGMKSNRYLTRDVQYELTVTDARDVLGNPVVKGEVTVTLSHEGSWNIPLSGPYTGYLRTMIPLGSEITSGSEIGEDRDDVYVLGEMVELQPGESVTYRYSYELPEYVWVNGNYFLHLHKQPGTLNDRYRVVLHAPQGMSFDAPAFDVRENTAFFEAELLTDQDLSFRMLEDTQPPRIVFHELTDMNQITILFNEPVATDYAGDALNYDIVDINHANSEVTDALSIASIRVDGSAVILTTTGMSLQPDERYEVTLRNLRDGKGNAIDPNPRTVTVLQDESFLAGLQEAEEEADEAEESASEETETTE